jgi:hypothetical protein
MKKNLDENQKVIKKQVDFARLLGLEINGDTVSIAYAKILDVIDREFFGKDMETPSDKQLELANILGCNVENYSRRVAFIIIKDIITQRNVGAIRRHNFKPGDKVINSMDNLSTDYVISSISEKGLVYFKGGQGRQAWASNIIKVVAV